MANLDVQVFEPQCTFPLLKDPKNLYIAQVRLCVCLCVCVCVCVCVLSIIRNFRASCEGGWFLSPPSLPFFSF